MKSSAKESDNKNFYEDVSLTSSELDEITSGMAIVKEDADVKENPDFSPSMEDEDLEGIGDFDEVGESVSENEEENLNEDALGEMDMDSLDDVSNSSFMEEESHTAVDMNSGEEETVHVEDLEMNSSADLEMPSSENQPFPVEASEVPLNQETSYDDDDEEDEDENEKDNASPEIIAEFEAQLAAKRKAESLLKSKKTQSSTETPIPPAEDLPVLEDMDPLSDSTLEDSVGDSTESGLNLDEAPEVADETHEPVNEAPEPVDEAPEPVNEAFEVADETEIDAFPHESDPETPDNLEIEDYMSEEEPKSSTTPLENVEIDNEEEEEAVALSQNELDNIVTTLDKSGGNIKSITPMTSSPLEEKDIVASHEFKELFIYLDQLLSQLPQEKIDTFARSKYYKKYHSIISKLSKT